MAILRSLYVSACLLVVVTAMLAAEAAGEPCRRRLPSTPTHIAVAIQRRHGHDLGQRRDRQTAINVNKDNWARGANTMPWRWTQARSRIPATPMPPTMRRFARRPP